MYNFRIFLQELSRSASIKFKLSSDDFNLVHDEELGAEEDALLKSNLKLGNNKATLYVEKKYELCIPILKYSIENKYRELFSIREQILVDIIEGKEVALDKVEKSLAFLPKGTVVFVISVHGNRQEALTLIQQLFKEQEVLATIYGDDIILIGSFDDIYEQASGIHDFILSELYSKCTISYSDLVYKVEHIKSAYEEARECIKLLKVFGIKEEILNYNKLLFEKTVYSIDSNFKSDLLDKFKDKFSMFEAEMITTIEEFINCDLNISDAAKKLYVHRNTLIYRLDKITKETGFDIRNFKEAAVFIVAFLVWKANR